MREPWPATKRLVLKTIARIKGEYLTRGEKARRIRTIRRTVRWGRQP